MLILPWSELPKNGHVQCVDILIEAGAHVNYATDKDGRVTPSTSCGKKCFIRRRTTYRFVVRPTRRDFCVFWNNSLQTLLETMHSNNNNRILLLYDRILRRSIRSVSFGSFAPLETLIGAVRNGGLLPFDDDIDIGILESNAIDTFEDDEFFFEKMFFGYKFKIRGSDQFLDIMVFEETNNGDYAMINDSWPNESFKKNELFPLKQITFSGDFILNIPAKHIEYLHRVFPEWDTKIKIDCGHHTQECVYDEHDIPREFDVDFDNSKYLCYTKFWKKMNDIFPSSITGVDDNVHAI